MSTRGRATSRSDQRGITLIECLVSVAILSIVALGVAAGTNATGRSAVASNNVERVEALLSSYAAAIQSLPYYDCASSATYDEAMRDQASPAVPRPFLQKYAYLNATSGSMTSKVEIIPATFSNSCVNGSADVGTQTMEIKATVGKMSRTDTIVKRDPDPATLKPVAVLSGAQGYADPNLITGLRNPLQSYAVSGLGSWATVGIYSYEFTCDARHPSTALPISYVQYDPNLSCSYDAYVAGDTTDIWGDPLTHLSDGTYTYVEIPISLTVTDNFGASASTSKTIRVYDRDTSIAVPDANFEWNPPQPYEGDVVTFTATGISPVVQWDWDFGDAAFAGAGSKYSCVGSSSDCASTTHTFIAAGTYKVRLTVRLQPTPTSPGVAGTVQQTIVVQAPVLPKPRPSFTMDPTSGIAPQRVFFDGTASRDAAGNPIPAGNYSWEIFNSADVLVGTMVGAQPNYKFQTAGTYKVALTVEAANGTTNTSSQKQITLRPLTAPTGVAASNAYAPLFGTTRVTVSWTNVPHAKTGPGRDLNFQYNILIQNANAGGGCLFGLLRLNNATGSYVTDNGNTTQSYTWQIPGSFVNFMRNVLCIGSRYIVQMQTIRTDSDGQVWQSGLSAPVQFSFDFGLW